MYTKGKWEYSPHYKKDAEGHIFFGEAPENTARTITLIGASSMSQDELNQHGQLISAAPDLLEACKTVKNYLEEIDDYCVKDDVQDETNPYYVLQQAINKAKGE